MLAVNRIAEGFLDPIALVIEQMRQQVPDLDLNRVMLVGAWCRDVLHAGFGHSFDTGATRDIDLALALYDWEKYAVLTKGFPRAGDSGLRFGIAGSVVDLIPFGEPENPPGRIAVPNRDDTISVWAFTEIFQRSWPLEVEPSLSIRCPTVPGYTAAKLAAWLDRSEWGETRDAEDLALTVHWYMQSGEVKERLYGTPEGQPILVAEELNVSRAAARLLGADVAATVGAERAGELSDRWPGNVELLVRSFRLRGGPQWLSREDRLGVVDARTRGLAAPQPARTQRPDARASGSRPGKTR